MDDGGGVPPPVTERQLQNAVTELASVLGWRWYHTHDSRRSVAGYPDLTLARGRRLVFVELKTERGRVRPMQLEWLELLERTGAEAYLWRPSDWLSGGVEACLSRVAGTPARTLETSDEEIAS